MKKLALRGDENGFAALLVAMVLITVVGLMAVGFAQLMRNEVNQATSRHLSNQAYYAAESGINDAVKALSLDPTISKQTCGPLTAAEASGNAGKQYLTNNNVDGTNSQWTCLLIDPSPGSLVYGDIDRISPTTFTMNAVDDAGNPRNIDTLTIYWQDASSSVTTFRSTSGSANNAAFPALNGGASSSNSWGNSTGMLRISITGITTPITREGLKDNTYTAYLYPAQDSVSGPNTTAFTSAQDQQGDVIDGKCNVANTTRAPTPDPRYCSVTFTGISASTVLVNLRSIYSDTSVYIAGDSTTHFVGAQSLVDATGRAQNVLKRVQVRIPSKGEYLSPGFVVEAMGGVCKQLMLKPGSGSTDSCTY